MASAFFKSIRFRVILWYMVFLFFILSAFSFLLYKSFKTTIYDDLDNLLVSKAEGITNSIDAYWEGKEVVPAEKNFIAMAQNWVEEKRRDPQLMSLFVQILDAKGTTLVSSKSMPHILPLPKEDFDDILEGEDSFDMVGGEWSGKQMKFRLYSKPVIESTEAKYVVQVSAPASLLSLALNNLRVILFILLPLTIFLAGVPGLLLARLTLRPVDKMINTLQHITAENLKLRIHLPDTKDEVKRLADTFNDMIERLDRSFSSQQRFIQDISNELKAPMNLLKVEIKDALDKACQEQAHAHILKKALKDIDGYSKTVEDLLILSSFEDSQMALVIKKINITKLIEGILKDLKPIADEKEIALSSFLREPIIVDGDEKRLRQLFINIVDNAVKYTYRKGSVSITAYKDGKYARVAISDTGAGIPENEIDYIFDRFYQVHARSANHGFGLGLSSAKSIVEAHKGNIIVESRYGKGSTFTVTLPLQYPG